MWRLKGVLARLKADLTGLPLEHAADRVERNIRINIYHGIVSIMALNLAAPFVGIFAVKIGASDYQVGLLSSGPALVSLLSMIPGGRFMDRRPQKKRLVSMFILLQRLFYVFISTIPFFVPDKRAWLLVLAVAAMNMPASIANIGWQAFISRVVPISRRAEAFAARNRLMNLAGTLVVLVTGRLIDIAGFPLGYQIFFAGAFAMSLLEIWVLGHVDESAVPEPPETAGPVETAVSDDEGPSTNAVKEILSHGKFVRYTLASIFFYLSWQTPWPLFTLYQVRVLGANNTWVSLLSLANTGGSLIGYGFWAKQCNKRGNLNTLFLSSLGIFIVPLAYAFSRSLSTVAYFNLLTGAIFSGVNLALFNQLLEVTPEHRKASYIAYYTTAVNASAIFAPMIGVGLLNLFGFFWAFIVCAALRVSGSFVFLLVDRLEKRISSSARRAAAA